MVVGAPPYPGFKGCSVMYTNQDMVLIWTLVIIWDAHKCKCIVQCPSSYWKGSFVDAHVGTRHSCMWAILVFKISSVHLIFSILDWDGGNSSLMRVVYSDGRLLFFFLMIVLLNLDIGILYIFGRSFVEWNNLTTHDARQSSHVSISLFSKSFPWVEELPLTFTVVSNCSDIGYQQNYQPHLVL